MKDSLARGFFARCRPVRANVFATALSIAAACAACRAEAPTGSVRVSGYVEATEVRIAARVGGRILEQSVDEGQRVDAGAVVAKLETVDAELALTRARAERDQANAQLRLLLAGSRAEDVRQAEAQLATAQADETAAEAELVAAQVEVDRFEGLLASNSGTRKQRDDAVARRNVADGRLQATRERSRAAAETLARLRAGARREEIDAARARVAVADAQIATLQQSITDATVTAPVGGIVTEVLLEAGETAQLGAPLVVVADLDHAWANVYVEEPAIARLRLGQPVTLFTDAGPTVTGTISYIAPRAEFTPRNVQTAEDRSKLVYRIKVAVDNREGVLKIGMPVEAELSLAE
jgi:HlyD family secretion protein